ncbi:hypothetical protein BUALT_BualtUnG0049400 [Buddleja alternifolia]|uniref:RNase III domain-containing protein n=1 Tax=Buddleja alternifolia TaxID=168488 RepID=A0AAV6VZY4_9LAMI|nr:hypothetical protein BUALT_BualtUnG0049400 [Buddleja alternifolia]
MEDDYCNDTTAVDTAKADRSILFMKCPPVVSKAWQASSTDAPPVAKFIVSLDPLRADDPSSLQTASYERLEYMGDAVLRFFMAKEHFMKYPDLPPGQLTKLQAANVDNEKLAHVALKYELHRFLRHKKPLLGGQVIAIVLLFFLFD